MFLIILMQALFALTFPVGKWGLTYAGPLVITGGRMMIAGILLLGYALLTKKFASNSMHVRRDYWLFLKTSLFYVYLAFVPEFWALASMSSLKSNMMWSSLPFVTALLSYFILHERLTHQQWMGMLLGTAGMIPLLYISSSQEIVWGEFLKISLPELMMFIAVGATAYGWFLVKELLARGYTIFFINGITMLLGGAMSLGTHALIYPHVAWYTQLYPALGTMILLVIISNIVAYSIYGYLLKHHSVTFLSFSGFLCPLFGAFFSWFLLGEQISIEYLISFILIVTGLTLFYRADLLQKLQSSD